MKTGGRVLAAAALLLFALAPTAARASETPPDRNWPEETKRRLETYRAASATTLKDVLTRMVEKTTQGEEYLGLQWQAETKRMLRLLSVLQGATKDDAEFKKWYEAEKTAWTNVQKIGRDLLDLHYRMASSLEEIEQDVKDSKAYYARLKGLIDKADNDAGRLNDHLAAAGKVTDRLDKFSDLVGKIGTATSLMSDHSQTVARLIRQFHKRQLEFIEDRGKLAEHKAALDKLKSAKIDPDQSGVFAEYEKKWEATMYKTYARYVDAVEAWKKENRWHDGEEQLYAALKTLLTEWMTMPHAFLGVSLPPFLPKNADELGEHCLAVRSAVTTAIEKFKGEQWARIEKGLHTAEEERREVRRRFEERLDEIDEETRLKFDDAREEHEKTVDPLEAELNLLATRYSSETDGNAKESIRREMRALERQIDDAERSLEKSRRYHLGEHRDDLEEEAYREFREAIRAIDDRVEEFEREKREID